ncbi:MAG: tRNA (adenosine(37)-N6)-threonylcarbamoyltransferase complex dimerization subunit type 1 TsaB [Acidobacteriia bacterium]|nr:tRNA (adenosine(37)-N6)-threonylcarbamoyltransferase complex dimerization subunit type 1 TsaB [Terriglobia bacterium]
MLILSADTSGPPGSVAFARDGTLLDQTETCSNESHSQRLFGSLQELLERHQLRLSDFDAFAVTRGPGSFAGLRIGVAALKAFGEVFQKPVVAVSTLEAIAATVEPASSGVTIIPLMDARRGEMYCGAYARNGGQLLRVHADAVVNTEDLFKSQRGQTALFAGPEIEKFESVIFSHQERNWTFQKTTPYLATAVAQVAFQKLNSGSNEWMEDVPIQYIRRSDAEIFFKG